MNTQSQNTYEEFIANKIQKAESFGFEPPSEHHESLKPHQRDIAAWMLRGGRRACFAAFGLGKTRTHLQVAKWICEAYPDSKYLIVAPLGVRQEFTKNEGPIMGCNVQFCRTDAEVADAASQIIITNYESVRDGKITIRDGVFIAAGLDEGSVLRSYGSKTYQEFLALFKHVKYRFVFTATPSPNRHKELIHYGGFLGIMDTGDALTRFFQRDSEKAGNLTLYPHMEDKFWYWLFTWAVFLQKPSNLGYSDDGYDLPPLQVHWHRIEVDHTMAWKQFDSWGQAQLLQDRINGIADLAEVKRETMIARLNFAKQLIADGPEDQHWLLWHDLEDERRLIERAIPTAKTAYGSQDLDDREDIIQGFARGEFPILATKPSIAGSGTNLQKHCHNAIFLGSTYKFNDFIQSVHRLYRFQQQHQVNVHIIYSEAEDAVVESLKSKWENHKELVGKMVELILEHGLALATHDLKRGLGVSREESSGNFYKLVYNDSVQEIAQWPENCVDEIVTSIPFGNQYEYSPNYNDFGHNPDNHAFFRQMDYLIPSLLRVLKPGRLACIHVKDRIRFGNVTGLGTPTVDRFSDKTADAFEKHGFMFMGRITIDTDVVRENNQTYRLGWTENSKDSTKMGVGMPEYVLLLRKKPSDLSNSYADEPVTKSKKDYTRADWQIDAASLWRSSGIDMPSLEALREMPTKEIGRIWRAYCKTQSYNHVRHVELAHALEEKGVLPSSFMLLPPIASHPDIWTDIIRMRVLNSEQSKRHNANHVCPLQLDIVERLIRRYSNPGEIILDPFAGIGTVPYTAVKMGRTGWGVELSKSYWRCSQDYCAVADNERMMPQSDLFAEEAR